ncbi:MAG TPA: type II toxin-antitoxin system HicB family antitoxin [Rhizomicrobium sp.]
MISFKLEKDSRGYHAWSPELPGCHTHGATRAEGLSNLKDAVRLYLDDVMEEALLPGHRNEHQVPPARRRA